MKAEASNESPAHTSVVVDLTAIPSGPPQSLPVPPAPKKEEEPVDFEADRFEHDDQNEVITASGGVHMVQAGRTLEADKVVYNLKTDTVMAYGHVVLTEANGDVHRAEEVQLENEFKNGVVKDLHSVLADGSRFAAVEGVRTDGKKTAMEDASYTPCDLCKNHPDRPPVWQIRASEVTHDEESRSVSYRNARFETYGIPVLYTPYFSHPDGTIKRKSGFLAPSAGYKSRLGGFARSSYYWDIAPDKDATFGVQAMTKENPLALGQWRQRWDAASLSLDGGVTYSARTDRIGGEDVRRDDELRGHVLADGLWDMTDQWRSGLNIEWATDEQYMRQYDITDRDILENEVYAERFSGRNYAVGRLLAFRDVRLREEREDQPGVLPEIIASFKGDPNSIPVLGGRWGVDASFLGLQRDGNDQDMNRMGLAANWYRRFISDYGLVGQADARVRADAYNTRDRSGVLAAGQSDSSTETRLFQNIHLQGSYPVAREFETMQARIEPVVALTAVPNINVNKDIPNEDSQDVQVDAGNIFEPNRFPGLDRLEDQSRLTYGLRTGLYGYGGSRGEAFLGQSRRFSEDDNPFPAGSGLDRQESDVVGQLSGIYRDQYSLDYRFQLASDTLASQRHEIDAQGRWNALTLSTRYLFAKALDGTAIDESREQMRVGAAYYLTPKWRMRLGGTQDLGTSPGLRKAHAGLDHYGQCVFWSLSGERNLTDESSGESDVEITFRIGLKNLSGFEESKAR
ncbi:MAG: LPS assembly protein LptD [Alphaproteobacteria bacterium]|nr:LPS assembly protein LptD [Alphaproteobacteria bacterium]